MTKHVDTTFRRVPERGSQELKLAYEIIDAARICHVGFVMDGQPYVLPMACARKDDELLLHGSIASRLMNHLAEGLGCCVTITHLDGLVLARSSFHSSMNYRSVMVFGSATLVTDEAAKKEGLDVLVEQLAPGRLAHLRESTRKEINATHLLSLPIMTFTAKVRTGPPSDLASDIDLEVWAGVVPLAEQAGEPETAPDMRFELDVPTYLTDS